MNAKAEFWRKLHISIPNEQMLTISVVTVGTDSLLFVYNGY
jgi:hypothetical protein